MTIIPRRVVGDSYNLNIFIYVISIKSYLRDNESKNKYRAYWNQNKKIKGIE